MRSRSPLRWVAAVASLAVIAGLTGCDWRGLNSLPLPGTAGSGPGAFTVQAQMPNVTNLQPNSRVRVGDVMVGNVTKVEMQGWHALLTMTLDGDVDLPANATVKLGQTSLFGSLHIELAPPSDAPAEGRLHEGSLIPLNAAGSYPSTEQTLAAISMVLNGGGVGQIQDITEALSVAFDGRADDLRSLLEQIDEYVGYLDDQKDDILAAADSLNNLVGQIAAQKPVVDKALETIPNALAVLAKERDAIADAIVQLGQFSALAADSVNQTKDVLVQELKDVGPVLKSLADAGPALTRGLDVLPTYPFPKSTMAKWIRGDYANLTAVIDLTLSRIDSSLFTGTRFEGDLTELELQWGRTIGQLPSPYTAANPLVVPYQFNQGP
ncbi:mammalian cell entry protein [Mycobacterium vulneris]|uniref:MCE family protein n=1 Tax=Mycolicibacterium septicum DSM 44393 TaxID=1341646 RepID=A0A7X6RYT6_9MYCO|nr:MULTISPECIES: MCE family protein [Mycolicibacterium]MBX8690356.1 MCE family protein [Mycobacterium sp. 20091114027_K0903767]MCP3811298.1 MCE family protein [Mycobacteriaceae bacterium Msp059]OCB47896.1 mammalian cell entry protein [Mycolicibacterium vulneris]NKZ14918.1 MCE family protein [Mycolicibacterium septicum DSM 44393]OBK07192.1 mammalian cell entry protein [Mycolicibacterium fortuitum]